MARFNEWHEAGPGIRRKIMTPGDSLMAMVVEFRKGAFGPEHAHPHEQITYVISGSVEMKLSGVSRVLKAGEAVHIAGDVPHSILALEDASVLETFTPLREDLLAAIDADNEEHTRS